MVAPRRGRSWYRLALLVLTAVVLLTLDLRGFGPLEQAQRGLRSALSPVRDAASWAVSPVVDVARGAWERGSLADENARLRAELEELRGRELRGEWALEALARLNEELELFDLEDVPREIARVVTSPVGNFDDAFVEIDKGTNRGLREGMAVVSSNGLVGKLVRVDANRSVVELLTSPQFAVGVRIGPDVALAEGLGRANPLRAAGGLSGELRVVEGDLVLTAGGGASLFPPDIVVGRIAGIDHSANQPEVLIEPTAELDNLEYVSVLRYEAPR